MYLDFLTHYEKDVSDEKGAALRFTVFKKKVQEIMEFNKVKSNTWEKGLNKWSDQTDEEFNEIFPLLPTGQICSATNKQSLNLVSSDLELPTKKDWRDAGVVPPVTSQGSCGSCWTFSTINTFESHVAIATKTRGSDILRFSPQQLVDCAQDFDNNGCRGGLPSHAFTYIYYYGIELLENYPYQAVDQKCAYNSTKVKAWNVGSFNITEKDEDSLKQAIALKGPVAVSYQVAGDFRDYKRGVYSSTICQNGPMDVNHAVTAIGYGKEDGKDYWLIKNSWGEDWGDEGYFKMEAFKNMCGIGVCNSFPVGVYLASK